MKRLAMILAIVMALSSCGYYQRKREARNALDSMEENRAIWDAIHTSIDITDQAVRHLSNESLSWEERVRLYERDMKRAHDILEAE